MKDGRNPEFLAITNSGISNLNPIYLRKVINSEIYLEWDRARQAANANDNYFVIVKMS
jgi:hypothetical protein